MEVVHRLGAVLCGVSALVWLVHTVERRWREREVRRRVALVLDVATQGATRRGVRMPDAVRRWAPVAGVVCAGYVLVGGALGLLVGAVAGVLTARWWRRRAARAGADTGAEAVRQLPLAADLLAACVAAGADPVEAARVVGESLGGPVGCGLARGAAQVRLGAEPGGAWRELAAIPDAGVLVRLLERAGESGAPAAAPVARFAAECRAEQGRRTAAVARRAAVAVTAPVGLCFLPAFLVIGVLPVVIGLAGGVLGGR
ncbi:type II secretion system F family protein [Streptomyces sp. VRA16 Mangrove soil]|uniref:type II secretion system F family protein n=1 Tax=Streptomyces sp. VRA16 Mangrove soil TaxID=2817434 RepID=UPI001A9F034E|nr:type II secretion system F family protein [Streptomyces sp. VRA16 Mangrove soil]MBO1333794.1 type II secretion system F family protein [Streptomyces sp. VRA16 Mangrove soil]